MVYHWYMGSVNTRRSNRRAYKRTKAEKEYAASMTASKGGVTITKTTLAEVSAMISKN